jgi:hypothetical protein
MSSPSYIYHGFYLLKTSFWLDKDFRLNVMVTMTFDLKINRGHLLAMENVPT